MSRRLLVSAVAARRLAAARAWLDGRAAGAEVLVVAAAADAGADLVRGAAAARGAAFGWRRATLGLLAAELGGPRLAARGLAQIGGLAAEAVVSRLVHAAAARGELGRYAAVHDSPGFARALARTLVELRLALAPDDCLRDIDAVVGALLREYAGELERAGLVDRAGLYATATAVLAEPAASHPWLGLPTLLLDLPAETAAEGELIAALARRAPELLATAPAGDRRGEERLRQALDTAAENLDAGAGDAASALASLQAHLFGEGAPPVRALDESVVVFSAPGEGRECVEIARQLLERAAAGVPFDRMAVLLRSPGAYRPHLEEALARARVPAHFARGVVRPDPSGRAFLALLRCAGEGLSARRFAEYLSLGEVPAPTAAGSPPPAASAAERFAPPDVELVPARVAEAAVAAAAPSAAEESPAAFAAPRRWENLLVEAAVIGGGERWRRRLDGLEHELALDLEALEDPDAPLGDGLRQRLADLGALRAFALPLLDTLLALPARAPWGDWLEALSALASRALRAPARVHATLAELAPMASVGPVDLAEVCRVLARRLLELTLAPDPQRYGRVYVAPIAAARGLSFEVVFVPGLAEKIFPARIAEEPILLDAARRALACGLPTNDERIAEERLALRLAAGAATRRLIVSYPRLDLEAARPRVASFYALEALRAAEGSLPRHEELAARAETESATRIGWPAPAQPERAIDEAEYDLALLAGLLDAPPERTVGTAHYLLEANPHLGRALRFRARRWWPRWTAADGLVSPSPAGAAALVPHQLEARSFSPTALQNFAVCPYRFFLYAVHRLQPREVPAAIEEMDPLQRGSLVHEVQFALLSRLRHEGLLPVRPDSLAAARARLDEVLDGVAEHYREVLAPAIPRVWEDGVAAVRADLREWLRRSSLDASGFVPWRFELAFGLRERRARDEASVEAPVALAGGIQLRGSIDLVERDAGGALRVTDHKTGKARVESGDMIAGGEALQPVFYSLATERLFPGAAVVGGRLYYCTATGGFNEVEVPLDGEARAAAAVVAEVVGGALRAGFLPAAPAPRACQWCDYREVCGPYEELRVARKPRPELQPLARLRGLR